MGRNHLKNNQIIKPFVGRIEEKKIIENKFNEFINAPKFTAVFIQGDYGLGKTSLIQKILENISSYEHIYIGQGSCSKESIESGLYPFKDLLNDLYHKNKILATENTWRALKEIAPAWLDVFTSGIASATKKTIEEGINIFGRNKFAQEDIFEKITDIFIKLSKKNILVLVLDDFHWADASSIKLMLFLLKKLENSSVFIICAFRPVEALQTGVNCKLFQEVYANLLRYGATEITLKTGINIRDYCKQRYINNRFDNRFIKKIQEITDGHPLFVEQLFSHFEEVRMLKFVENSTNDKSWVVAIINDFPIPRSVSALLDERIQLLQQNLKNTLALASVEGEIFTSQVITTIREISEIETSNDLQTLENRYKLVLDVEENYEDLANLYKFAHRFIREHVYDYLSKAQKKYMHQRVGECLEKIYEKKVSDICLQLTIHFREAGCHEKVAEYALLSAQIEYEKFSLDEAKYLCMLGLDEAKKIKNINYEIKIKLLLIMLNISLETMDINSILETVKEIQDYTSDECLLTELHISLSETFLELGDIKKTIEFASKACELSSTSGFDLEIRASAINQISWAYFYAGNLPEALKYGVQSLQLYETLDEQKSSPSKIKKEQVYSEQFNNKSHALRQLGYTYEALGQYSSSLSVRMNAYNICEANYRSLIWISWELAELFITLEEWEYAREYIEKQFGWLSKANIKEPSYFCYAYEALGKLEIGLSNPHTAIRHLTKALKIREGLKEKNFSALCMAHLSLAYLQARELSMSEGFARKAVGAFKENNDLLNFPYGAFCLASIFIANGQMEDALSTLKEGLEVAHSSENRNLEIKLLELLGNILFEKQPRRAKIAYSQALRLIKSPEAYNITERINKKIGSLY